MSNLLMLGEVWHGRAAAARLEGEGPWVKSSNACPVLSTSRRHASCHGACQAGRQSMAKWAEWGYV